MLRSSFTHEIHHLFNNISHRLVNLSLNIYLFICFKSKFSNPRYVFNDKLIIYLPSLCFCLPRSEFLERRIQKFKSRFNSCLRYKLVIFCFYSRFVLSLFFKILEIVLNQEYFFFTSDLAPPKCPPLQLYDCYFQVVYQELKVAIGFNLISH